MLQVTINLQTLYLEHAVNAAPPYADFSRLPYSDRERDHNPDTPNISEVILSKPFQQAGFLLHKGVHLFWSLPDAFKKGVVETQLRSLKDPYNGAEISPINIFPLVPNRWLVLKNKQPLAVVESDYLHPAGSANDYRSVSYPYKSNDTSTGQPFRYLGRAVDASTWKEDGSAERLPALTAIGYGEPTFSALYANCYSVFGYYDPGGKESDTYEVNGWYSEKGMDPVYKLVEDLKKNASSPATTPALTDKIRTAIKAVLGWDYKDEAIPEGIICYGSSVQVVHNNADIEADIVLGNSGAEALAVHLAQNDKLMEEQLLGLLFHSKLQGKRLDVASRFADARKEHGFNAENGGSKWIIKPEQQNDDTHAISLKLPPSLEQQLAQLNRLQEQEDKKKAQIASQRQLLFSDWYKYIYSAYPPEGSPANYLPADEIKWFIENNTLAELTTQQQDFRACRSKKEEHKAVVIKHLDDFKTSNITNALQKSYVASDKVPIQGNMKLAENKPFSEKCMVFHTSGYMETEVDFSVQSFSLWIYLQHGVQALSLLSDDRASLVDGEEFGNQCAKVYIDGRELTHYRQLQWHQLPKQRWFHLHIELNTPVTPNRKLYFMGRPQSGVNMSVGEIGKIASFCLYNRLLSEDERYLDMNILSHHKLLLKEVAAPRFWRPREPVVLINGKKLHPCTRHGQDGNEKPCKINPDFKQPQNASGLQLAKVTTNQQHKKLAGFAPFILEWEVEFESAENSGKHKQAVYSGRTVLTPYASKQLKWEIFNYLKSHFPVIKDIEDDTPIPGIINTVSASLDAMTTTDEMKRFVKALINALEIINDKHFISQSLGGLNNGFLMQHQVLQLPVEDPIGFSYYQEFTQRVATAIGPQHNLAPLPWNQFAPIREGKMTISRLRLIDAFGQSGNVNIKTDKGHEKVELPGTLVQPARINFRWLSAGSPTTETGSDLSSSPICGWIVPNHADRSIGVLSNTGEPLGIIDKDATWQPVPGTDNTFYISNIGNKHLQKVLNRLIVHKQDDEAEKKKKMYFLETLVFGENTILHGMEPETDTKVDARCFLMGRPLAVVRAAVGLEIKGKPANDLGWAASDLAVTMGKRKEADWVNRNIPLRIGDPSRKNNGVFGFWKESSENEYALDKDFHIDAAGDNPDLSLKDPVVACSLISGPQTITMLIDPLGEVHLTTDFLPTKVIDIPNEFYADVLQHLSITFRTGPILSRLRQTEIPLPKVNGHKWSWLEKERSAWMEHSQHNLLKRQMVIDHFDDGEHVWDTLVENGWIQELDHNMATITATGLRKNQQLTGLEKTAQQIEFFLDTVQLTAPSSGVNFSDKIQIKEGWLKLSPDL